VLVICRQHGLAAPVRQPVGIERHQHAADDREQAEADPGRGEDADLVPADARLGAGQGVDDAPEQHRLDEDRGRQHDIGGGQQPGQPALGAEQPQDAGIDAEDRHGLGFGNVGRPPPGHAQAL
jgi:hypothetical protein